MAPSELLRYTAIASGAAGPNSATSSSFSPSSTVLVQKLQSQVKHRDAILRRLRAIMQRQQMELLSHAQQSANSHLPRINNHPHSSIVPVTDQMSSSVAEEGEPAAAPPLMAMYVAAAERYMAMLEADNDELRREKNSNTRAIHVDEGTPAGSPDAALLAHKALAEENAALRREVAALRVERIAATEATDTVLHELGRAVAALSHNNNSNGNLSQDVNVKYGGGTCSSNRRRSISASLHDTSTHSSDGVPRHHFGGGNHHSAQQSPQPLVSLRDLRALMADETAHCAAYAKQRTADTARRLAEALGEAKRRDRLLDDALARAELLGINGGGAAKGRRGGGAHPQYLSLSREQQEEALFALLGDELEARKGRLDSLGAEVAAAERRLALLRRAEERVEEALVKADEAFCKRGEGLDDAAGGARESSAALKETVRGLEIKVETLTGLAHCRPIIDAMAQALRRSAALQHSAAEATCNRTQSPQTLGNAYAPHDGLHGHVDGGERPAIDDALRCVPPRALITRRGPPSAASPSLAATTDVNISLYARSVASASSHTTNTNHGYADPHSGVSAGAAHPARCVSSASAAHLHVNSLYAIRASGGPSGWVRASPSAQRRSPSAASSTASSPVRGFGSSARRL